MSKKTICDICGDFKKVNKKYKIKRKFLYENRDSFWETIDMCESCHNKMIEFITGKPPRRPRPPKDFASCATKEEMIIEKNKTN